MGAFFSQPLGMTLFGAAPHNLLMPPPSRPAMGRIALGVLLLSAFVAAGRMLPLGDWIAGFQGWVRGVGPAGYLIYILVYILFCVLLLPASPLTIGAGAIFGFVEGSLVVIAGGTLGATASFLLARTALRARVERMIAGNARFRALDRAIAREGGRIVFLVRLAPVFPFAFINFAFGLTGVRTAAYVVATFFGIIPLTLAFVYISDTATRVATGGMGTARLALNVAGVVLALVATAYVTRVATRAIRRAGVDEAA